MAGYQYVLLCRSLWQFWILRIIWYDTIVLVQTSMSVNWVVHVSAFDWRCSDLLLMFAIWLTERRFTHLTKCCILLSVPQNVYWQHRIHCHRLTDHTSCLLMHHRLPECLCRSQWWHRPLLLDSRWMFLHLSVEWCLHPWMYRHLHVRTLPHEACISLRKPINSNWTL